jgi:soluble lytic murein transglycosylase-like protein
MERQKTKWRFQNIVILSAAALSVVAVSPRLHAEPEPAIPPASDSGEVGLAARAKVPVTGGPAIPSLKGSLNDFKLPSEERFWELHGLRMSPELSRGVDRLSAHLVGTAREKASSFKYCEQRKLTAAVQPNQILTPDGVACLYWRWQRLLKDKKSSEVSVIKGSVHAKKSKGKSKKTATVEPNSVRGLQKLSALTYDNALKSIEFKSEKSALRAVQFALENPKDCRLTAVRAAMLRDLENFLPSSEVWKKMNELYAVTSPCLGPAHEAFEVVNARMALLHLDKNILSRAASLFEVSLQAKSLKDEHLLLFWRGFIDSLQAKDVVQLAVTPGNQGVSVKPKNTYWDRLIDKYPLTLHALIADKMTGNDPYERYLQRAEPRVSVYEGQEWNLENVSHLMAAIFLIKGKKNELERLSRLMDENVDTLSFETAMFRLKIFESAHQQRSVIKIISQSVKKYGSQYLCSDLLTRLYPLKYRNEIAQQAAYIDPALIFSLIRQESSFNPKATSPVGARGLMQVMPNTARRVERKRNLDLYDPVTNIRIGSKYLHILRNQHDGDYSRLIASYNAGPNNTKKWEKRYNGKIPLLFADLIPFPETRHYVSGLMRHMYWYRELVSHLRETNGSVRINWSWALVDVVPRAEQFGLAKNAVAEIKLEPLPWMPPAKDTGSAADASTK